MSKLGKFIRLFDIYGNYFQLRINNQTKFKTLSGGLLSLLTLIILILCVLSFGNDFFKRKNPKISIEEGLFQDSEIPILNGTEYPVKPILLTVPKSYSMYAKARLVYSLDVSKVNYIQECTSDYMEKYFPEFNLTTFSSSVSAYCFNLNDYNLSNAGEVLIAADECSKIDPTTLSTMLSKNITCNTNVPFSQPFLALNLYTKQIGFKPEYENPFYNKTIKYAFNFANTYITYANIFWNLQYLHEDNGWLIESVNDMTDLSPQPEIIQQKPADGKKLAGFYIKFLVNDKFRKYNRTYQKLQDVLAALGGFMKLILALLNLFSTFIRSYMIDLFIIDEKFEKEKIQPKENVNTKNLNCSQQSKNINNKLEFQNNYVNDSFKKQEKVEIKNSEKIGFCSYSRALILNFFNCKENKKNESQMNLLRKKLKIVNTFQDYSYILKKLNEFEILKKVILNDKQFLCFDYLAKPYTSEIDPQLSQSFSVLFNSEQINKENLINYFIKALSDEPIGGYDEKIFKYLNDVIKEDVMIKTLLNKN
jgi:hypothetical protein